MSGHVFVVSEWLPKEGCEQKLWQYFKKLMALTLEKEKVFDETWFYAPVERVGEMSLPAEETHHALRALRLKPGTDIVVSNGVGSVFRAKLISDGFISEVNE